MARDHFAKGGNERAVELHRDDSPRARRQRDGERADPGPDLEDLVDTIGYRGVGDCVAQHRIDEEVLAESVLEGDPVPAQQACQLLRISRIETHFIFWNSVIALARSWSASCSRLIPRSSATTSAVSSR